MTKQELRDQHLLKRKALTLEEVENKSNSIFDCFVNEVNLSGVKCIHCFLPIIKNNEVNTNSLLKQFQQLGINVVVPVSNFDTRQMQVALYNSDTSVVLRKGIPEPENPQFINPNLIDLVILPLAIFDKNGFRIGYGGGFYDRFLEKLDTKPQLVGVSFFDAIDDICPNEFDVPLDSCVTPSRTYFFKN